MPSSSANAAATLRGAPARLVFICFAAAYLLSYALRAINAVIAPALIADFHLSNADLGWLSAAYFVGFALLQLPLGVWLDRYGARRVEALLLLVAGAGAILVASADTLTGLWIGRALIGAGVSACLMAPFKAFRAWFAPQQQAQLASWMLVAGTAGALAATVPARLAIGVIGWRGLFWLLAGLLLCAAAAIFCLVKPQINAAAADKSGSDGGYAAVLRDPYFRRLLPLGLVNQGSFIGLQTLWAGPWMSTVLGFNQSQTANALFVLNAVLLLSYFLLSAAGPRYLTPPAGNRQAPAGIAVTRVIGAGLAFSIVVQIAMLGWTGPASWCLWPVLALFITVTTLVQSQVSLAFPVALTGRASTAYNLALFIGAFAVQSGFGVLADLFGAQGASAANALRGALAICVAAQLIALLFFVFNRARPQV